MIATLAAFALPASLSLSDKIFVSA